MIALIFTHTVLGLIVWFIAKYFITAQKHAQKLGVHRQISYCYKNDDQHKKKKQTKKTKKKHKRSQNFQVITLEEEHQIQDDQNGNNQDNQKEEKLMEKTQFDPESTQIQKNKEEQTEKITQRQSQNLQKQSNEQQRIQNIEQQIINHQKQLKQSSIQRRQIVNQQVNMLSSYFIDQLQQIVPYNGHYGHYKLSLQGTNKCLSISWHYNHIYPAQIIDININKDALNPLQTEILDKIISHHKQMAKQHHHYQYVFNLVTAIYQDLLLVINYQEEDKMEKPSLQNNNIQSISDNNPNFNLYKVHNKPEDIKVKKQIYGKILDQIFYLHDMVEKPDSSAMKIIQNEDSAKVKQQNSRGRYQSQFQELQLIGEGGFGKVYKVKHKLDGNIYAIKKAVVNYQDLNDRKMLKEVALLSKLNHPNIVRYYQSWLQDTHSIQEVVEDMSFSENQNSKIEELNFIYKQWKKQISGRVRFASDSQGSYSGEIVENSGIVFEEESDNNIVFQDDGENMDVSGGSAIHYVQRSHSESQSSVIDGLEGFPFKILYIAMELCSGINLREFINLHFDEEEQKIQLLRGILQGLAYIHSKRIIHRDLKPANIFLTQHNKVKIGDFGLATSQERSISISLQSDMDDLLNDKTKAVGTGFYRAPQQLKSQKYDEKVDIYSLGIIMFQLFYPFKTAMERLDVLKQLTQTHALPNDFQADHTGTDLVQNINVCLKENPDSRPSASKLLQSFRNKYFTQLVSCIANPKHFQFSELLSHLFGIKNQMGSALMWRDLYKNYMTSKILKIYQIHRGMHFPTLPLIPVQDFHLFNGQKIKASRAGKYLLLTERGSILEFASNGLKSWLKYAKDALRRKKLHQSETDEQRQAIRRFTFQKIVHWQPPNNKQDLEFHEKMVTAFDITYRLQEGFNPFYFCEALKISEAIALTLNLTQRRPPIYISHSLLYKLLAQKFKISTQTLYSILLSINEELFNSLSLAKKINYLQERHLPSNFSKKLCQYLQNTFQTGVELLDSLQLNKENQQYKQIQYQIQQTERVKLRVLQNSIKWKLQLPPSGCNGLFWQIAFIKGLTSVQQYANGQQFCNYHIETNLDQDPGEADVSLWCIGEYLQEDIHKLILQCWKNGLATRWYDYQVGQKDDMRSRHNVILRRKNERVQVMVRHNEARKGEHRQERQSSFISLEQFNWDVIKQMSTLANPKFYH